MGEWLDDIRTKTSGKGWKKTLEYIADYYWYHILILAGVTALIIIFAVHYAFGNKKPLFTLVAVNQEINTEQDNQTAEEFAEMSGIDVDRIEIDSNYNFSYGEIQLTGVNESYNETFFFRWRNKELDAVIMPESLYLYCVEMGGEYRDLSGWDTGDYPLYTDGDGQVTAVILGEDEMTALLSGGEGETLLLAFPSNGKHESACREFMRYMVEVGWRQTGE